MAVVVGLLGSGVVDGVGCELDELHAATTKPMPDPAAAANIARRVGGLRF